LGIKKGATFGKWAPTNKTFILLSLKVYWALPVKRVTPV